MLLLAAGVLDRAPGASIEASFASGSAANGFRVSNSPDLDFPDNTADDDRGVGFRIEHSPPFATAADVTDEGNAASHNRGGRRGGPAVAPRALAGRHRFS